MQVRRAGRTRARIQSVRAKARACAGGPSAKRTRRLAQACASQRTAFRWRGGSHTLARSSEATMAFNPVETIPANLRAFLTITEIDDAEFIVGALFRRKFGAPPPDVGRHLVAFYKTADGSLRLAGFSHMRPFGDVYLSGGSCSDGDTIRAMSDAHREAIHAAGG